MPVIYKKLFVVAIVAFSTFIFVEATSLQYAGGTSLVGVNPVESIKIKDFPFIAVIKWIHHDSRFCLGTILNKYFVVSLGWCVRLVARNKKDYSVQVGSAYSENAGQIYEVGRCIVNSKYNSNHVDYNIGLIKLAEPLIFGPNVAAATLGNKNSGFKKGMEFNATGYSTTQNWLQLKRTVVSFMSRRKCQRQYNDLNIKITEREVCVRAEKDIDFMTYLGGPLVLRGIVVGFSWAYQDCETLPGRFIRISLYRKWIDIMIAVNS